VPTPPPPTSWDFALESVPEGEDLVGVGADLEVGTLVAAYSIGIFPMGLGDHGGPPMGWWSPDPRGVLRLPDLRVTRSLRKSMAHFETRVDTAFEEVLDACADPARDGRWITGPVREAYVRLHREGWAHSVETWRGGELVGGLYGVAVGGLFAGESMFHSVRDASKVALVALRDVLADDGDPRRLIDVQWRTDHLASLGVVEVSRADYLSLLPEVLSAPLPQRWA
jgi:leucyl/phenylalanyl-tRNA--protein transferase